MSRWQWSAVLMMTSPWAGTALGDEPPAGDKRGELVERLMKEFDEDGDGRLNEQERATAARVAEQFLARVRSRQGGPGGEPGDRPGRGPGDRPGDRPGGRPDFAEAMKRFDKDGDGKLNDEEREAAMKARQEMMRKGPPGGFGGNPPEAVLKRFDKDGDGKLSEDERAAAQKEFANRGDRPGPGAPFSREEFIKRFDKDGDGKLNEEERAAAQKEFANRGDRPGPGAPFNREEFLKRFDKDGDGKLSEDEEAAARAEMQKRRGAGGPFQPSEGKPQEPKLDKEELLKKFDKDGDGKLNEEEKGAAREAFQNRDKSSS